jgi:hypothetical protein
MQTLREKINTFISLRLRISFHQCAINKKTSHNPEKDICITYTQIKAKKNNFSRIKIPYKSVQHKEPNRKMGKDLELSDLETFNQCSAFSILDWSLF